ncbi:META domain-containing protein [Phaeobacter porticola]|uniref:Heat shock protein n=1 Tax=Phaeobacter porticola TaxID=1844006 RepID=A0A1L3I0Z3_9RHOB|nr:META domain-containing protein [Phaeobacter porticola]APG45788.1 Heat shock protein [Phaeobacter porticola]
MKLIYAPLLAFASLLSLVGCFGDETLRAYGGRGTTWQLREIDKTPVAALTTLEFPKPGVITGQLPCNQMTGQLMTPYPWFEIAALATTRMVCPTLREETDVLTALQQMDLVEIKGSVLLLTNDAGREMLFTATD